LSFDCFGVVIVELIGVDSCVVVGVVVGFAIVGVVVVVVVVVVAVNIIC
jgi:hypothetical protein